MCAREKGIENQIEIIFESKPRNKKLTKSQKEDYELGQRSTLLDESTPLSAETQRESVGVINKDFTSDLAQNSDIKQGADDMIAYQGKEGQSNANVHTTFDQGLSSHPENVPQLVPIVKPGSTLTDKAYTAAAGIATGVGSFFMTQTSYDDDNSSVNGHPSGKQDVHDLHNTDHMASRDPILKEPALSKEQSPIPQIVKDSSQSLSQPDDNSTTVGDVSPEIQETHMEPPIINEPVSHQDLVKEPEDVVKEPTLHEDDVKVPISHEGSALGSTATDDMNTRNLSVPSSSPNVSGHGVQPTLKPPACSTNGTSFSSTRVITHGIVPTPVAPPEQKRKNSLPKSLKNGIASAFRRLSLNNESKKKDSQRMSDAEIFKNQMIQQQMSAHPASVIPAERPAVEIQRSNEHIPYTGVDKKNSRIPGVYSLSQDTDMKKIDFYSGKLKQRRGSIQKMIGKITKNESMCEKGIQAEISGREKVTAYKNQNIIAL